MGEELEKEKNNMDIWNAHSNQLQAHSDTLINYGQRITALEANMSSLNGKMDNIQRSIDSYNGEQKELLQQLLGHHLDTKKVTQKKRWEVIGKFVGGGGLGIAAVYGIVELVKLFM